MLHAGLAGVGGFDKELGFFDELSGGFFSHAAVGAFVPTEEVVGEFTFGEAIEEEFGVVKSRAEFADDTIGIVAHIEKLRSDECLRGGDHGLIGHSVRLFELVLVEQDLRLEDLTFGEGQIEIDEGNDFARAFAFAAIAVRVFARVTPVGVEGCIFVVIGYLLKIFKHRLEFAFADARDVVLEGLAAFTLVCITCRDAIHEGRDVL